MATKAKKAPLKAPLKTAPDPGVIVFPWKVVSKAEVAAAQKDVQPALCRYANPSQATNP